jgi:hypothetical protein
MVYIVGIDQIPIGNGSGGFGEVEGWVLIGVVTDVGSLIECA